jgi:hypothetical protein
MVHIDNLDRGHFKKVAVIKICDGEKAFGYMRWLCAFDINIKGEM